MSVESSFPLPLDPSPPLEADDKRLWIGNIDSRLSEYNLLKILQQFGPIKKFDFLFHNCGPLKGKPRGYCFVTYEQRKQAEAAMSSLNGKLLLDKDVVVKWAHTVPPGDEMPKTQTDPYVSPQEDTKNIISQISAIEAKLKAMEEQKERELEMCLSAAASTAATESNPLQLTKNLQQTKSNTIQSFRRSKHVPYSRHERKHYAIKR